MTFGQSIFLSLFVGCCSYGIGDLQLVPHTQKLSSNSSNPQDNYNWVYTISLKSKPTLCLDLIGGQAKNGINIQLWECNGMQNQLWFFDNGGLKYAGDQKKCIDATATMQPGARLMLWDCGGYKQQMWGYDTNVGTIYLTQSATKLGVESPDATLCMDLAGGSSNLGTPIQLWGCNGLNQQQWNLQMGITIRVGQDYKKCLDIAGGKVVDGAAIQLWDCNGQSNQYWVWETGSFNIKAAADMTKCIDSSTMQNGDKLKIWTCNGGNQQKFGYDSSNANMFLNNGGHVDKQVSGKCLDMPGGQIDNGVQMDIWDCNGCWNQDIIVNGPTDTHQLDSAGIVANGTRPMIQVTDACPTLPTGPTPGPGPPKPPTLQPMDGHSCTHGVPNGWPKFDTEADMQKDGQWSKYFTIVYGGVPKGGYPICTSDFYTVNMDAAKTAGLHLRGVSSIQQEFGHTIYLTSHNAPPAFKSHKWVEGAHCRTGGETASAWYWYLPGSGIWLYSGNTKAYNDRDECAQDILGVAFCGGDFQCGGHLFTTAKSKYGYDSIQYIQEGLNTNSFMFIMTEGKGHFTCGANPTTWKAGWAAEAACNCDQNQNCGNCKGYNTACLGSPNHLPVNSTALSSEVVVV